MTEVLLIVLVLLSFAFSYGAVRRIALHFDEKKNEHSRKRAKHFHQKRDLHRKTKKWDGLL